MRNAFRLLGNESCQASADDNFGVGLSYFLLDGNYDNITCTALYFHSNTPYTRYVSRLLPQTHHKRTSPNWQLRALYFSQNIDSELILHGLIVLSFIVFQAREFMSEKLFYDKIVMSSPHKCVWPLVIIEIEIPTWTVAPINSWISGHSVYFDHNLQRNYFIWEWCALGTPLKTSVRKMWTTRNQRIFNICFKIRSFVFKTAIISTDWYTHVCNWYRYKGQKVTKCILHSAVVRLNFWRSISCCGFGRKYMNSSPVFITCRGAFVASKLQVNIWLTTVSFSTKLFCFSRW